MHIDLFCSVIECVILSGYDIDHIYILCAFPEHLQYIINLYNNNTILNAIALQNKYKSIYLKNMIQKYYTYFSLKNESHEIKLLDVKKFDLVCYDNLNIKNKLIHNVNFDEMAYFSYSMSKILNNNHVKNMTIYSGKLGHRFEMYDLTAFLNILNINEYIESFKFADMKNLDINKILLKMPKLKSLSLTATSVYTNNVRIPCQISCISPIIYQNLQNLHLIDFCERLHNDDLFKLMSMFPNLISVSLISSDIEDNSLLKLFETSKNLLEITLTNCKKLSIDLLMNLPMTYPNLETFVITDMNQINDDYIIYVLQKCKKLKRFMISDSFSTSNKNISLKMVGCVYKYFNTKYYFNIKVTEKEYQMFLTTF